MFLRIPRHIGHYTFALLACSLLGHATHAEIIVDGSLNSGERISLDGPNFVIPANLGLQNGSNLFHSFEAFDVFAQQSATFTDTAATGPISNILSRVTGGSASTIDGLLASTIPGADLFFINPAGVMFGPNAQLNVQGSFHVSTADYLKLGEDGRFAATTDAQQSLLTSAPPSAFGFLGDKPPAAVSVDGAELQVPDGETLSVASGDLEITGGTLVAPAGRNNIASVASQGEVALGTADVNVNSFEQLGAIDINDGRIDSSGESGGTVLIRSGRFTMDGGFVGSATRGSGTGGTIDIAANENVALSNSAIAGVGTFGDGAAGAIKIKTHALEVTNDALIDSSSFSAQKGGTTEIEANHISFTGGGRVVSASFNEGDAGRLTVRAVEELNISGRNDGGVRSGLYATAEGSDANAGKGGTVSLSASTVNMTDGGIINTGSLGNCDAGNIEMNVSKLVLTEGASIRAGTEGLGNGGMVHVVADESVFISGRDSANSPNFNRSGLFASSGFFAGQLNSNPVGDAGSIIVETPSLVAADGSRTDAGTWGESAVGKSGSITLNVEKLQLSGGSQVANSSRGVGEETGGNLTITAKEILISGIDEESEAKFRSGIFGDALGNANSGLINISADVFSVNGGRVTSDTTGKGKAGDIMLDVGRLELANEAQIFSGTEGTGNGGKLTLKAETISIKGTDRNPATQVTGLFSNVKDNGSGAGGDIEISANQLRMSDGAEISAETRGQGRAGSIIMVITDEFESDNSRVETAVALPQSSSFLPANEATVGGNIHLQSSRLSLKNNSEIFSQSQRGPGNAGNISIQGNQVLFDLNSVVSTKAVEAAGGNIQIRADTFQLTRESPISASVTRGQGGGGNVTINARSFAALENSDITASADTGFGGDITINAEVFLRSPNVDLDASSNIIGNEGNVQINTPDLDIAGSISNLPTSFLNAASRLSSRCTARTAENMSSFVMTGTGGVPLGPEYSSLSGYADRTTKDSGENAIHQQANSN